MMVALVGATGAGCSDDESVDAGPADQDGASSPAVVDDADIEGDTYVADVVAGRAVGATVAGVPGAVLVYGGLVDGDADGYDVLDTAVVVGPEGVQSEIATGVPLVDPSVSLLGENRVLVVGRRCERALIGDTGVTCEPATAAGVVIDLEAAEGTELQMPFEASDPTGIELSLTALELGGDPIVRVTKDEEVQWWLWNDELTNGELLTTSRPTGAVCSTGEQLIEVALDGQPPEDLPMDASQWDTAVEPRSITLRRFDPASGNWSMSEPSEPMAVGSVQLACSAGGGITVLVGDLASATTVALVADPSGGWQVVDGTVGSSVVSAVSGLATADVLAIDADGTGVILSPETLATRPVEVDQTDPAEALTLVAAIGADGFGRLVAGPPATVQVIS